MDLHQELSRHGTAKTADASRHLRTPATEASLAERVARGRRRRAARLSGFAVTGVAAVALVGVGVWNVWPAPIVDAEPAGVNAGPYRYEVGSEGEISQPTLMLRGDDAVMCGDELSLEAGVTVHDPDAFDRGLYQEAELTTLGGTIGAPTAEPRPLNPDDPDGIMTGWDPEHPVWDGALGGELVSAETVTLLMDGDTVVGHVSGSSVGGAEDGHMGSSGGSPIPRVGECRDFDLTFEEMLDLEHGDPLDTLLVTQFWGEPERGERAALGERVLLATIVVDPNQPANSSQSPEVDQTSPDVEEPASVDGRPGVGTEGYLASHNMAVQVGDFSCTGTLHVKDVGDPDATGGELGSLPVPIPSWIETGRLYGYGDDALVGGYPIPLGPDAVGPADQIPAGQARLLLTGDSGDTWVFDVAWSERDDLPHDAPGWFVELGQVWDCGVPDPIAPGDYEARLLYAGDGTEPPFTAVLKPITIVDGVPSIPEIDAQG